MANITVTKVMYELLLQKSVKWNWLSNLTLEILSVIW